MNSERVRAIRCLFWVALCLYALVGQAQMASAEEASEQSSAAYKELIEQALSEFKHKNWPEARVLFVRAHELNPNARTLRGMGIVSFEMRDYLGAVVNLKAALEDTRQPLTDAQRKECEALLTRARTYVGVFSVKVDPPNADLMLDGIAPTRDEQGQLMVPFGDHVLTARAAGYQETSARLSVQGGERGEITLSLLKDVPPVAQPTLQPGPSTLPAQPVAAPAHSLSTRQPESQPSRGFVGHGLKYTWVALGTSALFGAGAGVMWALGNNKLDDLDQRCQERGSANPCTRDNTSTDSVERYELATNVSLGVSVAAFAAAAVLMGLEWPRERNVSVSFGDRSLSLRGAF